MPDLRLHKAARTRHFPVGFDSSPAPLHHMPVSSSVSSHGRVRVVFIPTEAACQLSEGEGSCGRLSGCMSDEIREGRPLSKMGLPASVLFGEKQRGLG